MRLTIPLVIICLSMCISLSGMNTVVKRKSSSRKSSRSSSRRSSHESSSILTHSPTQGEIPPQPAIGTTRTKSPISLTLLEQYFPEFLANSQFRTILAAHTEWQYSVRTIKEKKHILIILNKYHQWITPAYTDARLLHLHEEWRFLPLDSDGRAISPIHKSTSSIKL